uniref:NADH-ubiquinone oxidoreductase chain 4 n=1 Tax=Endelus continentalis TaxID=2984121 RepID=A0A977TQ06_9COLE|nr:NADH dehydrogenase subunit 4 [Endelus continentalis]UXX50479.1 NADH dehydrogenase subunit 4 [Endelus continentalis]
MMKCLVMMVFMIPLCLSGNFWVFQGFLFLIMIFFITNFSYNSSFLNLGYYMGLDLVSFLMVLLTFWIGSLMILSSFNINKYNNFKGLFLLTVLFLLISLFVTFMTMHIFLFYLFFEISLIPTIVLILGWGYQPERIQAGFYLFFYMLMSSLPMMISLFFLNYYFNSMMFVFLNCLGSFYVFMCVNMVFFIKMPMYIVHLWLPKAHVEAPISGSMILAGVMLKLGGYGLIRFMGLFLGILSDLSFIFISISLLGGLFVSLICLRQTDLKSLIAYSSVAHMGLVISGLLSMFSWGLTGSVLMMIAHGLCSSGLFCLANMNYERIMSRSLYLNKGLINLMPPLSMFWFLFCAFNMAAPPSLNLFSEIMLINSLVSWSSYSMIYLFFMSFFSGCYSLYLYSSTQHGSLNNIMFSNMGLFINEYLLLFLHILPLTFIFLKSNLLMF